MSGGKLTLIIGGLAAVLAAGVALGALLSGDGSTNTTQAVSASDPVSQTPGTTGASAPGVSEGDCQAPPGQPYVGGPTATVTDLGQVGSVRVEAVVYPRPDYEGAPWSQWGQGLVLSDGRFLSAIGDHLGPDGNSYLFEYDPTTGTLATIGDILSYVEHQPGSWGYGKVHGQMVAGSCGEVYFSTYWGSANGIRFDDSYGGDVLLRLDPSSRTIAPLVVPVPEHGVPSLAGSASRGLVYGEAIDPILMVSDVDEGPFFVYDTASQEVIFEGSATPHLGFRNVIVDAAGRAYYAIGNGQLARYDPDQNEVTTLAASMPGEVLRASTVPADDGRVFAVTDDESAFFVLHPSGEIESLGYSRGYTTSMALHPDGDRFFYVPDAHGGAWYTGAPLVSVNTDTGEETVIAELNPVLEDGLGLLLGGTYNIVMDPTGETLYIGMNAGAAGSEDPWGEVVLLIVHLS